MADQPIHPKSEILTLGQRVANRLKAQPGYQTFARPLVWPAVQTMPLTPQHHDVAEPAALEPAEEVSYVREPTPGLLGKLRESLAQSRSEPALPPTAPTANPANRKQIARKPETSPLKGQPKTPALPHLPTTPPSTSSIETIAPRRLPPTRREVQLSPTPLHEADESQANEPQVDEPQVDEAEPYEIEADDIPIDETGFEAIADVDMAQNTGPNLPLAGQPMVTEVEIQPDLTVPASSPKRPDGKRAATQSPAPKVQATLLPTAPPTKTQPVQRVEMPPANRQRPESASVVAPETDNVPDSEGPFLGEDMAQPDAIHPEPIADSIPVPSETPTVAQPELNDKPVSPPNKAAIEQALPPFLETPPQVQMSVEPAKDELTEMPTLKIPDSKAAQSALSEPAMPPESSTQMALPAENSRRGQPDTALDSSRLGLNEEPIQTSPLMAQSDSVPPQATAQTQPNRTSQPPSEAATKSSPRERPVMRTPAAQIRHNHLPPAEPTTSTEAGEQPSPTTLDDTIQAWPENAHEESTLSSRSKSAFKQKPKNQNLSAQPTVDESLHQIEDNHGPVGGQIAIEPNPTFHTTPAVQRQPNEQQPEPPVEPAPQTQPTATIDSPEPQAPPTAATDSPFLPELQVKTLTQVDDKSPSGSPQHAAPTIATGQPTNPIIAPDDDEPRSLVVPANTLANSEEQLNEAQPVSTPLSETTEPLTNEDETISVPDAPLPPTDVSSSLPVQQKPLSEISWVSKKVVSDQTQSGKRGTPSTAVPVVQAANSQLVDMPEKNLPPNIAQVTESLKQPPDIITPLQPNQSPSPLAERNMDREPPSEPRLNQVQPQISSGPPAPTILPKNEAKSEPSSIIQPFLNDMPEAVTGELKENIPAAVEAVLGDEDAPPSAPAMDLDTMAREVYQILQRRLRVEMERYRG